MEKSLDELFEEAREFGEDGHITIFGFTTNWKIIAGTPDFDQKPHPGDSLYPSAIYKTLKGIQGQKTIREALESFIETRRTRGPNK